MACGPAVTVWRKLRGLRTVDRLAVDRDVERRRRRGRRRRRRRRSQNSYSASSGKVCGDEQAAARAERQPLDVLVVRPLAGRRVGDLRRRRRAIAHGLAADLHRRRDVALHERRRHGERFGDVVEAFVRVVGRQQRLDVDVDRQQIADGVGVLGAVQAMERRRVEVRARRVGAIEPRLERGGERVERGARRAAACRSAASCPS